MMLDNILAIDVEDWYHPEYVKNKIKYKINYITNSFNIILNLIEQCEVKATFFIVGEIAEKNPNILREIKKYKHEIAFHGYNHEPLWNLDVNKFHKELKKYNSLIYSITGEKCIGFRAPSYSIDNRTLWALDVLEKEGYRYDASVFPIKTLLYGVARAPIHPYYPSSKDITKKIEYRKIIEFPALVYSKMFLRIPVAGGFYLRTMPLKIIDKAIKKINKHGFPAVLSVHPWELDDNTPRIKLSPFSSFITYYNLKGIKKKLNDILLRYNFIDFKNYLYEYDLI